MMVRDTHGRRFAPPGPAPAPADRNGSHDGPITSIDAPLRGVRRAIPVLHSVRILLLWVVVSIPSPGYVIVTIRYP